MNEVTEIRLASWATMIKARSESGKTIAQWCADNNVSQNAYYYWLWRLRSQTLQQMNDVAEAPAPCFAQVPVSAMPAAVDSTVRIHSGKMTIEISNDTSENILSFLKEVLIRC